MIDWLLEPLRQGIVVRGVAELVLIGVVSGGLGCWIVFSDLSYGAESLAHGMLPGLVAAGILGVPILFGGAVGLLVAAIAIALVARVPRLDAGSATSVVVTTLLGLGVLLGLSPSAPAGLDGILFGDVLGVSDGDILLTAALAAGVTGLLVLLHPSLLLVGFDRVNARALGRSPLAFDVVLALLLALATLVAVQALGSLLVVAMLVGPAASARLVSRRMAPMMVVATLVAALASVAGLWLSYHADVAAGASVTLALGAAFAVLLTGRSTLALARRGSAA
jgi:ABC-type Mn2+/Zn2+ transport system permease subunit